MTTPTPTDSFWSRLAALTRKEMHQLLRDRSNLAMGIVLPIVLILIFGYGMSFDVKDVRVAVVLEDRSPTATEVLAGLELSAYITPVVVTSMHDAERLMLKREVDGIVRVPSDFSRQLNLGDAGLQAKLQIIVHGVDANRARAIQTYVQAALGRWRLNQANRWRAGCRFRARAGESTRAPRGKRIRTARSCRRSRPRRSHKDRRGCNSRLAGRDRRARRCRASGS